MIFKNTKYLILLFLLCALNSDVFAMKRKRVPRDVLPGKKKSVSQLKKKQLNLNDYSEANINKMFGFAEKLNLLKPEGKAKVISFFTEPEKHLKIINFQEIENVKDLDSEGMDPQAIKIIPKTNFDECVICSEEFSSNDLIFVGACRHYFHDKCAKQCIESARERKRDSDNPNAINEHACPVCRQNLLSLEKADGKVKNSELILSKGEKVDFEKMDAKELRRFLIKRLFYLAKAYLDRSREIDLNGLDQKSLFTEILKLLISDEEKYNQIRSEVCKKTVFLSDLLIDLIPDLKSVAFLMICENLKIQYLDLETNSISDISVLGGLTGLDFLNLGTNSISDISVLSELTSLKSLWLGTNSISDINVLSGLTGLKSLYLETNSISDISVLGGLTGLDFLNLGTNSISDISVLSELTSLKYLNLGTNSISDISVLSELTSLKYLYLGTNSISDISALSGLTGLKSLNLGKQWDVYSKIIKVRIARSLLGNNPNIRIIGEYEIAENREIEMDQDREG